jgi:hypothetical protein
MILCEMTCPTCGIQYAVPEWFIVPRRKGEEKGNWHCPNGHRLGVSDTELDRVRRQRDRLKQEIARLTEERDAAIKREQTAQRALERNVARASAGVCPCCHRTFRQLQLHMKTKHPDVVQLRNQA